MERYKRHFALKEIGKDGQKTLLDSHAVVVGVGALGGNIATQLVRAGVGKITLCEYDIIDIHNLPRQVLYNENDVGASKLRTAEKALRKMNSHVKITGIETYLCEDNASEVLAGADVVMDGTDNMAPRYVINEYCVRHKVPFVYGGVLGTYGMTMNIVSPKTPCLSCIFPRTPHIQELPSCEELGVINTIPTIIGSIQASEAMKILLDAPYSQDLIVYDVWTQSFDRINIQKKKRCNVCSRL